MKRGEGFARVTAGAAMALFLAPALAAENAADTALGEKLVAMERESWAAWKAQDASFFARVLSEDHVELGAGGRMGKAEVVKFIASGACKVESYAVDAFKVTPLSATAVLLTYHAEQKTTCYGKPVPSPCWTTAIYALREGEWKNVLFEELPAAPQG
jgi:hypothetical protein